MAKKDKKKGKKKDNQRPDAVGAVRTAVERTFHATADSAQSTRTRAQDLVDEVAGAASRLREMIEQIGVLEDLKKQVEALSSRVAALERGGGAAKQASSAKRSGGTGRAKASGGTTRAKASGGGTRAKASGGTRAKASGGTAKASGGTTRAKRASSPRAKSSGSTRPSAKQSS